MLHKYHVKLGTLQFGQGCSSGLRFRLVQSFIKARKHGGNQTTKHHSLGVLQRPKIMETALHEVERVTEAQLFKSLTLDRRRIKDLEALGPPVSQGEPPNWR